MEGSPRFFTSTGKVDSYGHPEIIHIDALFAGRENGKMIPYIVTAHYYFKDDQKVSFMIPILIYSNVQFKNNIDIGSSNKKRYQIKEKGKIERLSMIGSKAIQKLKFNADIPIHKQTIENVEQLAIVGENIEFETLEIIHVLIEIDYLSYMEDSNLYEISEGKDIYPFKNKNTLYFLGWYRLNGPNGTAVQYDDIEANLIGNCVRCDNPSQFIEVSEHGSTYCSKNCQIKYFKK